MTLAFIFAIAFTIGISALCSVLEAMILSTTTAEIEALKNSHPGRGNKLEKYKLELEETSSLPWWVDSRCKSGPQTVMSY